MNIDLNRILIENAVRLSLRNFDCDDKRCLRKLIDTGIHLAGKGDKNHIFENIGELFADEDSLYYPAVSKLMKNSDREKFIQFGINLGYNTFNKAATTIQQNTRQYNKNIPWIADMDVTSANSSGYSDATFGKLIDHYNKLGINAFILRFDAGIPEETYGNIISVIRRNQYTIFIFMLSDEALSDSILDMLSPASNILVCLPLDGADTKENTGKLSQKKLLWSVRYTVDSNYASEILSESGANIMHSDSSSSEVSAANGSSTNTGHSVLARVAELDSPIVIFETDPSMTAEEVRHFNNGMPALRKNPPYPVLMVNLNYDIQNINVMTSGKEISTHITVKPAPQDA
ncbi:MAG: hypothetical protein IJJ74_08280 [Eubacterium sp.]|nr:hypothetical protein [Eubacterium sp.]